MFPKETESGPESIGRLVQNNRDDRLLRVGYSLAQQDRYPFNEDITACSDVESAYFLHMEKNAMALPPELEFAQLESSIPEKQRPRIKHIWRTVLEAQRKYRAEADTLKNLWGVAPEIDDQEVAETITTIKDHVHIRMPGPLKALIASSKQVKTSPSTAEDFLRKHWSVLEKDVRLGFLRAQKNFFLALRTYYEMLLERDLNEDPEEPILPLNHPDRQKIAVHNRSLRLIDGVYQALAIAKGTHHRQPKGRIRKGTPVPYWYHLVEATGAYLMDVVPYTLYEERMRFNPLDVAIALALHDIMEDTTLSFESIEAYLKRLMDIYDTSIDQQINSGYRDPDTGKNFDREKIKHRRLDLMNHNVAAETHQLLRILSKNTELSDVEKAIAQQQSVLGPERTQELLGSGPWMDTIDKVPAKKKGPCKAVQLFPVVEDVKMDTFLLRLKALSIDSKKERDPHKMERKGLMAKIEDRANNVATLEGTTLKHKRKTLRSTVSRLIAYAMLDFDKKKYPLFNTLPRLIDVSLEAYKKFQVDTQASTDPQEQFQDEIDGKYLTHLQQWAEEVPRFQPTQEVNQIRAEWEAANRAA